MKCTTQIFDDVTIVCITLRANNLLDRLRAIWQQRGMPYHYKGTDEDFRQAVREQRAAEALLREQRTGEARALELLARVEREREPVLEWEI